MTNLWAIDKVIVIDFIICVIYTYVAGTCMSLPCVWLLSGIGKVGESREIPTHFVWQCLHNIDIESKVHIVIYGIMLLQKMLFDNLVLVFWIVFLVH